MAKSPNRFFKCFCPDCPDESKGHEMSPRLSDTDTCSNRWSDGNRKGHRKNLSGLRRLGKAFLFSSSLVKMISRKKSQRKSSASKHNTILTKINDAPLSADVSPTIDLKSDSNYSTHCSSLNLSSSTTSSTQFYSKTGSPETSTTPLGPNGYFMYKQARKQSSTRKMFMGKNRGLYFGLFLFVVCLLICWGKVCAIFCTSTLLVLAPSRVKRISSMGEGRVGLQDAKECKVSVNGNIAGKES